MSHSQTSSTRLVKAGKTGDDVHLHALDSLMTSLYSAGIFVFERTLDPELLISSLSQALALYPVYAGRLVFEKGKGDRILCNDAGVNFTIIQDNESLPTHYPSPLIYNRIRQRSDLKSLFCRNRDIPLLDIKLFQMKNGGSILRIAASHCVADGYSETGMFVKAWSRLIHDSSYHEKPDFDRACIREIQNTLPSSDANTVSNSFFRHSVPSLIWLRLKTFVISSRTKDYVFRVSNENLNKLMQTEIPSTRRDIRKSDLITAYLWQLITRYQSNPEAYLSYVISFKKLLKDSKNKLLNSVITRDITSAKNALIQRSIESIATDIMTLRTDITAESVARDLAFIEKSSFAPSNNIVLPRFLSQLISHGISINNTSIARIYNLDFGSGTPIWCQPPSWDLPGYIYIVSSPKGQGFDIHVRIHNSQSKRVLAGIDDDSYLTRLY